MAGESWSVLPTDLLHLVLFNLVLTYDLVRLSSVCKSWWQPVLDHLRRRPRLPWIISFDQEKVTKLDLLNPWFKKSYSLAINNLLLCACVHGSQYGWLVLSKQEPCGISFLFCNPFRNEIIELPVLDLNTKKQESKAMFSNSPASPDCVFFVPSKVVLLDDDGKEKEIYIFSICIDKKWTSIQTTNCWGGSSWHVRDVIYMDGKFYCMFENYYRSSLNLGIFNVALQEWTVLQYDFLPKNYRSMIEADGELFLVSGKFDWNYRSMIQLWQFNRSEKTWKRAKSFGDRVLFLHPWPFPSMSPMAAVGEAKEFADTIVYLGFSGRIRTYTCKDDHGHWTPYRTHDLYKWFPSSQSTLWIDGPNFLNLNLNRSCTS